MYIRFWNFEGTAIHKLPENHNYWANYFLKQKEYYTDK